MSASSALLRGRRAHEKLMIDRCVIHAVTAGTVPNEATGIIEDTLTQVYPLLPVAAGPCKLTSADSLAREIEAGSQMLIDDSNVLDLPVSTSLNVEKNHIVTLVAAVLDPDLIGVKLRIEGPSHQTYATARSFRVEEIS